MKKRHSMTSVGLTASAALLFIAGAGLIFLGALLKLDGVPQANWYFAGGLVATFLSMSFYIASVITPVLRKTLGKGRMPLSSLEDKEESLELRELEKDKQTSWEEDLV